MPKIRIKCVGGPLHGLKLTFKEEWGEPDESVPVGRMGTYELSTDGPVSVYVWRDKAQKV